MSVQVNLTFNSVDEAIVALGRMVAAKAAAVVPPIEKTPRQARSDAGKTRGPHKAAEPNAAGASVGAVTGATTTSTTGTTDTSKAANQAANSTSTTPAAPAAPATSGTAATTAPAAPKAPAPSADDVQKAVEKLFNAKGFEDCAGVLSRFGVKRGKDLAEEQRADFIAKTERVIAGEAI